MGTQARKFDVVVLGAGVVGINCAYFALRRGLSVVADRRSTAGLETSFANGGQVSVSHAEPWANPRAPLKILKWLLDPDAAALSPAPGRPSMALDCSLLSRLPAVAGEQEYERNRSSGDG